MELIDIETEEGFQQIFEGLDSVPSAWQEGKKCSLKIDEETQTLLVECKNEPGENQTA